MVERVKATEYVDPLILERGNGLLLYCVKKRIVSYDIILQLPITESTTDAFRLFSSEDKNEAKKYFNAFRKTVPYIVRLTRKANIKTLNDICEAMKLNPSWSVAHLIVLLNKPTFLLDPDVQSHKNDVDENNVTPIMMAILNDNIQMVKTFITHDCSLHIISSQGDSVLHLAAEKNEEMLALLLQKENARQWLNTQNAAGHTPLVVACLNNQLNSAKLLYEICLNEDGFDQNTLLHHCKRVETLSMFIGNIQNINATNLKGQTALHIFVAEDNYDCVVFLLVNGAWPSMADDDNNTPLHIAVKNCNLEIVEVLIVFGADINFMNKNGETPRHLIDLTKDNSSKILYSLHAIGAKRCPPDMSECKNSCSSNGTNDGPLLVIAPPLNALEQVLNVATMERAAMENRQMAGGRLLCLDGGGIRGLVLIQILKELENLAQKPIIKCFDWVAGTSTGGILALALSSGKTLEECQKLYFTLKDDVFKGDRPYSSENLQNALKEYFGKDLRILDLKKPKIMITTVKTRKCPLVLNIFRNYPSPKKILEEGGERLGLVENMPVWEVARMTSAAPTYFPPYNYHLDGGLLANNPTLDALTDILEYGLALRATGVDNTTAFASMVVSCGTGVIPTSELVPEIYGLLEKRPTGIINGIMMISSKFKEILNLITELITGTDGRFVDRARAWCCSAGVPYYRFNPQMSADVSLDETSNKVIIHTLWETKAYMYNNRVAAREAVDLLLR